MKRKLFISLCLAGGLSCFAQEDVSDYYLKNNGFDEEFNYAADRSGNIAGDIINEVYGWDNETTSTYTVAGTFAYNTKVTFNGSSALPAKGYNDSEGGALALTTGWGMQLVYSQTVTLPKGTYSLCSAYYNVGTGSVGSSMLAWVPNSGTATASAVKSFPVRTWKSDTLTFILTEQTTGKIRIGFAANEGIGSASQAKLLVDYVKLLCDEVDKSGLAAALKSANTVYKETGVYAAELKAVIDAAQAVYDDEQASASDVISYTSKLTETVQTYKYKNATATTPLVMTPFITNYSFEDGTIGWENSGMKTQTNTNFSYKSGQTYLERWVGIGSQVPDVSIRQTVKGIPNGKYRMRAAVLNIQQKTTGSTVNVGEKQTGACLFADFFEVPVDTMKRTKELYFTVVDGQVTIGFKTEQATGNWVCVDNFTLFYLGESTAEDYSVYLNTYIKYLQNTLQTARVQTAVRNEAETVILSVQEAATGVLDEVQLLAEKARLDSVKARIEASRALYKSLEDAMTKAEQVKGWYEKDETKHACMAEAIRAAQEVLDNPDLTDGEIESAVTALNSVTTSVDKKVYTAQWSMGDVNNPNNNYYIGRTRESKNWILFWEKGYGDNPETFTCGNYTIDVDEVLRRAEIAFDFYTDSLKFIRRGSSKTDTYKMVIRLRYEPTEWEASGSGVDNLIGLLTLTPWAAPSRNWQTLYHEIGHCFQYQVHCDNGDQNGWMYAPGGGSGCAFWEQCAQWQAYKIMPGEQFTNEWFSGYLDNVHKHILHESPRYNNYFIQDYWSYRHGMDFMGRLWNESRNPEDAVSAYQRITGITNEEFFDEMYDCAARFATWDIPALASYGSSKIASRPQPAMTQVEDDYWRIDATVAPENTGHNIIKLNVPQKATTVTACFEGLNRQSGYRVKNATYAEWRYGFVAQLQDGSRVYGDMGKSTYREPKDTIRFECPAGCQRLYFVVSGGTKTYWTQVWDDNDSNDEQWPYQVRFGNTNRYGSVNLPDVTGVDEVAADNLPAVTVSGRTLHVGQSPSAFTLRVVSLSGICVDEHVAGRSALSVMLPAGGFYLVQLLDADGHKVMTKKILVK